MFRAGLDLAARRCCAQPALWHAHAAAASLPHPLQQGRRPELQCSRAMASGTSYDAVVLGTGAFGSSAAYHLTSQGAKVLAIDMYRPGHPWGSSHGQTRIIRLAYFEGLEYVKLIRRSYGLFLDLQEQAGEQLFHKTGMLDVGVTFERALASALHYNIPHEVLTASEVNSRFPGYGVPDDMQALYQPDGGLLCPEKIVQAHCQLAAQHGLVHRVGDRVVSWQALGSGAGAGVSVQLASGDSVTAGQLVICAGPWMSQLVPETKDLCKPERQVVGWFETPQDQFDKRNFPVFIIGREEETHHYYGFPQFGDQAGLKIGFTQQFRRDEPHDVVNPDSLDRGVLTREEERTLRYGVRSFFPAADGRLLQYGVCMYTNTPDTHFIIDRHPKHEQVILCSACSGHGFKMSSGVGQLLADMVVVGGRGSAAAQDELRLHRISPEREGHADFIRACRQAA